MIYYIYIVVFVFVFDFYYTIRERADKSNSERGASEACRVKPINSCHCLLDYDKLSPGPDQPTWYKNLLSSRSVAAPHKALKSSGWSPTESRAPWSRTNAYGLSWECHGESLLIPYYLLQPRHCASNLYNRHWFLSHCQRLTQSRDGFPITAAFSIVGRYGCSARATTDGGKGFQWPPPQIRPEWRRDVIDSICGQK